MIHNRRKKCQLLDGCVDGGDAEEAAVKFHMGETGFREDVSQSPCIVEPGDRMGEIGIATLRT